MLTVANEKILRQLAPHSREALEMASAQCMERQGFEVTVSHLLYALLQQPSTDVARICRALNLPLPALEQKVQAAFEYDRQGATQLPVFSPMLLEALQDALVVASAELGESEIRTGAILIAILRNPGRYCHFSYHGVLVSVNVQTVAEQFGELTRGSIEGGADARAVDGADDGLAPSAPSGALEKYGRDLTAEAQAGEIDPVFCREEEIALMVEILGRRRKNNPILVGDPGVGKTALAEGLALRICSDNVPPGLSGVRLWELDLGALQAGASVRGEFERRLKAVLGEVQSRPEKIVIFIDEAHTLIGAGGQAGGSDAANLLKPALARGKLRAIAATTWSEYKKYFEKDAALTRRFQLVKLDEPSPEQAVTILRGLSGAYEELHQVYIPDAALSAAARLSHRYLSGKLLPDKAIDVLDTACVRVAGAQNMRPAPLERLLEQIAVIERETDALERDLKLDAGDKDTQALLEAAMRQLDGLKHESDALERRWKKEKSLVARIVKARRRLVLGKNETDQTDAEYQVTDDAAAGSNDSGGPKIRDDDALHTQNEVETQTANLDKEARPSALIDDLNNMRGDGVALVPFEVSPGVVADVIADWTGVPAASMNDNESARLNSLGEGLRAQVLGQDEPLALIHDRLKAARLDLIRESAPRGVFFLAGPSGVGKTETAEQVARQLFGGCQFLCVINMSEYQEKHSASRLIGSPPGYVGYGDGGVLTEALRKMPYSVILLDEVEKAHPDILNLFYQVFDKGVLNDGEGREINCANAVFFLTSNLGSDALMQNRETVKNGSHDALETAMRPHLGEFVKPALLARMRVLIYRPLGSDTLRRIITLRLAQQAERLSKVRKLDFTWDDVAVELIESLCNHQENGARMVEQVIERWVLSAIADETLTRMAKAQPLTAVRLSARDDGFELGFEPELSGDTT